SFLACSYVDWLSNHRIFPKWTNYLPWRKRSDNSSNTQLLVCPQGNSVNRITDPKNAPLRFGRVVMA
ncbi:MAG: hypothetical protein FWC08_12390, partial [Defluviitaleaceae bacterium]|nr:hypothetical protein [Defluviitaleaceae bacterium]